MNEEQLETIARRVQEARLAEGLSKEAVARKAEVSSITYKRVEDGKPVQDASLARVLGAFDLFWDGTQILTSQELGGRLSKAGEKSTANVTFVGVGNESEFEFLTRVREDLTDEEMAQLMKEATPFLEVLMRDIKARRG